jgi:hypothetical protein
MAQTKRKRRTKHRGNAAGSIEARGRTGRKPTDQELRKASTRDSREERRFAEPTWGGAALRAGFASIMLFALFQLGLAGNDPSIASSLILSAAAFLIYVPLGYNVDRFFWKRRMAKAGRALPPAGRR